MPKLEIFPEDHMHYAYGMYLLKSTHPIIRKMHKTIRPSLFGQRAWGSSFLLIDYLSEHPLTEDCKLLELGCGWGVVSVYAASQLGIKATGMDIDDKVFPYMDTLAATNDCRVKSLHASFAELNDKQLSKFNVLVGADVCFWESLITDLVELFKRAQAAGVQQIIISDPGRSTFAQLCDRCESLWPDAFQHYYWYALEPKRFEGQIFTLTF